MQAIKPRNQMDPALCWRLEDMVATDALWQERLTCLLYTSRCV